MKDALIDFLILTVLIAVWMFAILTLSSSE